MMSGDTFYPFLCFKQILRINLFSKNHNLDRHYCIASSPVKRCSASSSDENGKKLPRADDLKNSL